MTVSPARANLPRSVLAWFIGGLGGVLLGAVNTTFGPSQRYFLVEAPPRLVLIAVIGGLGSLSGAVVGSLWVVGLPAFWPGNETRPAVHVEYRTARHPVVHPGRVRADRLLRTGLPLPLDGATPPAVPAAKSVTAPPVSLRPPEEVAAAARNLDGSVLVTDDLTVTFGGLVAVGDVSLRAAAGRGDWAHREQRRREIDAAQRDRRLRAEPRPRPSARPRREREASAHPCPPRARPHLPVGDAVSRTYGPRDGAARVGGTAPFVVLGQPRGGCRPSAPSAPSARRWPS